MLGNYWPLIVGLALITLLVAYTIAFIRSEKRRLRRGGVPRSKSSTLTAWLLLGPWMLVFRDLEKRNYELTSGEIYGLSILALLMIIVISLAIRGVI